MASMKIESVRVALADDGDAAGLGQRYAAGGRLRTRLARRLPEVRCSAALLLRHGREPPHPQGAQVRQRLVRPIDRYSRGQAERMRRDERAE
jgi:hypothetical protein